MLQKLKRYEITKESIQLFFGLFSALGSLDIGLCEACSAQVLSPLNAIIYSINACYYPHVIIFSIISYIYIFW